jgi:hypothetical protein
MKKALKILVLGGLVTALSLPVNTGALLAGDSTRTRVVQKPSFQIGLDIQFDAEWISFSGNLKVRENGDRPDGETGAVTRGARVELGGVPNLLHQARRGVTLMRALRTTTMCLVRQWMRD